MTPAVSQRMMFSRVTPAATNMRAQEIPAAPAPLKTTFISESFRPVAAACVE